MNEKTNKSIISFITNFLIIIQEIFCKVIVFSVYGEMIVYIPINLKVTSLKIKNIL